MAANNIYPNTNSTNPNTYANGNAAEQSVLLPDSYKGFPTIGIWKVNALGQKVSRKPVVSFGLQKARALVDHFEEIRAWVEQQEAERFGRKNTPKSVILNQQPIVRIPKPTASASSASSESSTVDASPSIQIHIDSLSNEDVQALKKRLGI